MPAYELGQKTDDQDYYVYNKPKKNPTWLKAAETEKDKEFQGYSGSVKVNTNIRHGWGRQQFCSKMTAKGFFKNDELSKGALIDSESEATLIATFANNKPQGACTLIIG